MSKSYKHNLFVVDYNKGSKKISNRITRRKINSGKYDDLLFFTKSNKYRHIYNSYDIHDYKFYFYSNNKNFIIKNKQNNKSFYWREYYFK